MLTGELKLYSGVTELSISEYNDLLICTCLCFLLLFYKLQTEKQKQKNTKKTKKHNLKNKLKNIHYIKKHTRLRKHKYSWG